MSKKHKSKQVSKHKKKARSGQNKPNRPDLPPEETLQEQFSASIKGRIISRFGQHADVENERGEITRCHIRRNLNTLVTGDWVMWRAALDPKEAGIIEKVLPRQHVLARRTLHAPEKILAANIEQIAVVAAVKPALSFDLIDSYLIAAEHTEISAFIVLNKIDLLSDVQRDEVLEKLSLYPKLGYPVVLASTKSECGLDVLTQKLTDKTSIFVGQSGVGKSSLINKLLPEVNTATHEISERSGLGQHTTTAARLYHFKDGGDLIDSPGVRDFSLPQISAERLIWCFPEFREFIGHCRFSDCKHEHEPQCAFKDALAAGKITQVRFDSYKRLLEKMAPV